MKEHSDDIYNEILNLQGISFELSSLSSSFYATGNIVMANRISAMSEDIRQSSKAIRDGLAYQAREEHKRQQQSSANMLAACLAGVKLNLIVIMTVTYLNLKLY